MTRKCSIVKNIAFLFLCVFLAGCASVRPGPFVQFNDAVKKAGTGIDAAMSVNYDWTRSGFISGFSTDTASRFSQIIVQVEEKYSWRMEKEPLYFDIKKARSALSDLNTAFARYASLLLELSGGKLASTETFDLLAKDLNKNVADAAAALKIPASPASTALISTAFSEAAKLFIEHKRQKYLIEAISKNQENIEKYSGICIGLVYTIRGNMKTYYVENAEPVKKAWNAATGEKRQKQTEAMLDLNDRFIAALEVLKALEAAYAAIPAAHADLSKAIAKPRLNLEGIQQLYSSGLHLQRLYTELKTADQK